MPNLLSSRSILSAVVTFTLLIVTIAAATFGRVSRHSETVASVAAVTATNQLPVPTVRQKAPAVADAKTPESAAAVVPSAPESHPPRLEPAASRAKSTPPVLSPIPARVQEATPVVASAMAKPTLADDTDEPAQATLARGKEIVWIEDFLPAGAYPIKEANNEEWLWVRQDPAPFSGAVAHQSKFQSGTHQHAFVDANPGLKVEADDILTAYVFIDPNHPPVEIMLQWHAGDGYFSHRAYWGANNIDWGTEGTPTRQHIGPLPLPGQWALLQIPASQVGLGGLNVTGMSFTIVDGRATWDRIGKLPKGAAVEAPAKSAPANIEQTTHENNQTSKNEYENILTAAYTNLPRGRIEDAIDSLEKAQRNPRFVELRETIKQDLECVHAYREFLAAATTGIAHLSSSRSLTLKTADGKETVVGVGSHCSVKEFKDDTFWIEERMGDASAERKLALSQLAPQSLYDLAELSLVASAASNLKLGFGGYIALLNDGAIDILKLRNRLENAQKDATVGPAASRVLEKLNTLVNARVISAGIRRIEVAIKSKDFALSRSLLRDFKRDFGTDPAPSIREFIEKATFDMSDLKPGLWTSYYCGDEQNLARKYLFSRAETKLNFNWGRGSPDPRVPNEFFAIRFNGLLRIHTPATYTFMATADDCLELSIDGKRLLNVTWNNDSTAGRNCAIRLDAGDHEIRVIFKQYLVDSFLNVKWKLDNESKWLDISDSMLWYDPRLVEKYQKDTF